MLLDCQDPQVMFSDPTSAAFLMLMTVFWLTGTAASSQSESHLSASLLSTDRQPAFMKSSSCFHAWHASDDMLSLYVWNNIFPLYFCTLEIFSKIYFYHFLKINCPSARVHMNMCTHVPRCQWSPREVDRSPGAGVTGACEPTDKTEPGSSP